MPSVYKATYVVVDSERRVISADAKASQNDSEQVVTAEDEEDVEETAKERAAKIVSDAQTDAEQIVTEAKESAEKLLHDARMEVADMIEKNRDQGRSEGYDAGYKKGVADTNKIKADADKLYKDTLAERQKILSSIEGEVVKLILDILDKLISDAVYINPQIITYLIKNGLNDSTQAENITIRVSPEDFDTASEMRNEFITTSNSKVDIVSDTSLKRMDCVIETQFGSIDCSLDGQFTALKGDLQYLLKNG